MDMQEFIAARIKSIEALEITKRLSWWNLATTGEKHYADELQQSSIALRMLYSSSDDYQFLRTHQEQSDPFIKRQIAILLHQYAENQIPQAMIEEMVALETEIECIYTNFRPIVEGKSLSNNELKEILVKSIDSKEREEAWKASKEIGKLVEQKILKLIALRNKSARKAGFDNYYTMQLELQDLDEKRLFELLEQLDHSLQLQWDLYKTDLDRNIGQKMNVRPDALMPWHYQDPFFQEAPSQGVNLDQFYSGQDIAEISRSFYDSIGLPVEDILARSDLYEREGKSQHAFCTCIDHEQDIRILCNLRDNEYWMSVQLHELGHAVYDKYIDQTLPFLFREPAHICMTEAIAMFFGRFGKSSAFLKTYCSKEKEIDQETVEKSVRQTAHNLLVFAKWTLVMIHFERAMYQQPEADLNSLWWDYVEKFQGVKKVLGRHSPDWASKLHLACAPVYYQNYILGEMTASQLKHYMKPLSNQPENFPSKVSGEWLKTRLFHLGKQFLWEETLQKVTGELLNPRYFVEDAS